MKQIQYIATLVLISLFTFHFCGCSEKDEPMAGDIEKGIVIESITPALQGLDSNAGTTRAASTGFSVNTDSDPTFAGLETRSGWKMDFTIYDNKDDSKYEAGSFTGATYSGGTWTWTGTKYFPNYKKPQAEVLIYPDGWSDAPTVKNDQSKNDKTDLLAQDILFKEKGAIDVAHDVKIEVKHKHSMLDFKIKDVVIGDIQEVKVWIGSTEYTPYKVTTTNTGAIDVEYMLILPETTKGTANNPVVQITTISGTNTVPITYRQTIQILNTATSTLGSNKCYCFTLQGADLKISPVTVLNWTTGESLPGEYIAVTAYPTFKAEGHKNETYYFYYDNKLMENGKPKLQEIKFNENAECTIKPDGRILTHIYKEGQVDGIGGNSTNKTPNAGESGELTNPVVLGQMVIDLASYMPLSN